MKLSLLGLVAVPLVLAACRDPAPPPIVEASAPPSAGTPPRHLAVATTASVPVLPVSADAITRVQAILPRWIELLERGDDETFIDEAVMPEELEKVLGNKTKAELVSTFRQDKREGVLKMLKGAERTLPKKVREERDRTLLTYDFRGEKGVTFVVVGPKVYVKN